MNVTLCSAFRNSARYLDRYLAQVAALDEHLAARGDALTCIWGEGDSTDDTRFRLLRELTSGRRAGLVVDVAHGGPHIGSVVDAGRFRQLAYVANRMWAHLPLNTDVLVQVESDLIWAAETLLTLIDCVQPGAVFAPMVMDGPDSFYDIYVFRKDGAAFTKKRPFHPALNGSRVQVDSAGSCLAIPGAIAQAITCPAADVLIGTCRQIYAMGGAIWLDPTLVVYHP